MITDKINRLSGPSHRRDIDEAITPGEANGENAFAWAVRGSFVRYVTVMARGSYAVDGGAAVDEAGVFTFPLLEVVREDEDWRLSFVGSVRFTAHHGLLDVMIKDPELVIGPDGGVLATHTSDDADELIAVATTDAAAPITFGGELVWQDVSTQLTSAGAALFGAVYPSGSAMAPIGIRVALGL